MENGASPIFPDRQAAGEDAKSFYGATGEQVLASSLLGWPVYGMSAETQERELEARIAMVMGVFEPLLILTMGAVVLVIVLAILLPIFELNQLVN